MLHLYGATSPENQKQSNAICSALQLINFLQDIAIDYKKNRVYVPLEDFDRFNIAESQIESQSIDQAWTEMMRFQTQRARNLMMEGYPLAKHLPGRIGWELRLVVQGGLRILELIDRVNGDIFHHRPHLSRKDWCLLCWRAIFA